MKTPKELFLENDQVAAEWRTLVDRPVFESAVTTALAQTTLHFPSHENLIGIRRFLDILTTLGDKEKPAEQVLMPRLTPPESLVPESYKQTKA